LFTGFGNESVSDKNQYQILLYTNIFIIACMKIFKVLILFLFLASFLMIAQPVAALPETYVSTLTWQSPTTGPGPYFTQFGPHGIGRSSSGILYVAVDNALYNQNHRYVEGFSSQGSFAGDWGKNGGLQDPGMFFYPVALAVNSSGWVHVGNGWLVNNKIERFQPTGSYGNSAIWSPAIQTGNFMCAVTAIDIDSMDNIYVADSLHNRLFKLDLNGAPLGSFGYEPGYRPGGIAVEPSGRIWVSDQNPSHYRIVRYNSPSDTNPVSFSSFTAADGTVESFIQPAGITLDSAGNVYIVNSGNNRIVKGNSNGNLLALIGSGGSGPGQMSLNMSSDVAVDPDGTCVYVTDSNHRLVQKYCKIQYPTVSPNGTSCCCCCNAPLPSNITVHVVPLSPVIPLAGIVFTVLIYGMMRRKQDT